MPRTATDGRVLPPDAMPLDYMLSVIRDPTASDIRRERMAALAAPYCHERVSYREVSKGERKAKAARKAGKDTEWAGLIKNGILAARTGKKDSLREKA